MPDHTDIDYEVMAEALLYSRTTAEDLRDVLPHIVSIQAKFYNMSEVPGAPGTYHDISVDNEAAVRSLLRVGTTAISTPNTRANASSRTAALRT